MTSFNRGEWSELYGVLFLLVKPKLKIVDSNFNTIEADDIFTIEKIILESTIKLEYQILDDTICIYVADDYYRTLSISEIEANRKLLLSKILSAPSHGGAFEVPSIEDFLFSLSNGNVIKAKSGDKSDIKLIVFDSFKNNKASLKYSIKSSLGSPATILNASQHTNFRYRIDNLNPSQIMRINSINSRTKLLDRINLIKTLGGKISFQNVVSESFDYNLRLIDTKLPEYLGNALLYSYSHNNKNIKDIFLKSNDFEDEGFGLKKLADLIEGLSFGMIPSKKWNGVNSVNGGLIIIKSNGDVVVLDLIYYKKHVTDYIVNQTKLDSPSTRRYHMLEIEKEEDGNYFTLNLQIRYKN